MKKLLLLLALVAMSAARLHAAEPALLSVSFVTSRAQFETGDSITIQEVHASSPRFEPGDTVRVRGAYTLQSRPSANIGLSLSSNVPTGSTPVQPGARAAITAGSGTFDLVYAIQSTGSLHVSFSPSNGSSFGGVYFAPASGTTPSINPAGLRSVPFSTSRAQFANGDSITLSEVLSSSPALAAGDRVIVRGSYQLQSRSSALLMLSLTINVPGARTVVAPTSRQDVTSGNGTFELEYEIVQPGSLHVSFYGVGANGNSFGGVYFAAPRTSPATAEPGVPTIVNPAANTGRLANLSTRGLVSAGEGSLVVGLNITEQERYVLIRAIGPSLSAFGIGNALSRPVLSVYDSGGQLVASASSWTTTMSAEQRAGIEMLTRAVGGFPLTAGSHDSIAHLRLVAGAYTVVISSGDGQTGVALGEIYASPTFTMQ